MEDNKFILERDIKDIETYLERVEREPHLYPPDFVQYKKLRLEELKKELKRIS